MKKIISSFLSVSLIVAGLTFVNLKEEKHNSQMRVSRGEIIRVVRGFSDGLPDPMPV